MNSLNIGTLPCGPLVLAHKYTGLCNKHCAYFQKVFYKVRPLNGPAIPDESVTRSCSAGVCEEKNDFLNCTYDKLENPGCSQRFCCEDNDLCNYASTIHHAYFRPVCVLIFIGVSHSLSR